MVLMNECEVRSPPQCEITRSAQGEQLFDIEEDIIERIVQYSTVCRS
jgi:hypothetical protein